MAWYPKYNPNPMRLIPAIIDTYFIVFSLMNLFPKWSNKDNEKNHNITPIIIVRLLSNAAVFETI